jgi:hypothetical protein
MLATSCRKRGITLITRDKDFERFLPFLKRWHYVTAWPSGAPRVERAARTSTGRRIRLLVSVASAAVAARRLPVIRQHVIASDRASSRFGCRI